MLPPRGLARRVPHLEPVGRSSRDITRVPTLRYDPFEAERAYLFKHGCAVDFVTVDPVVEHQSRRSIGKQPAKIDFSLLERIPAAIVAGQLDQIEGTEKRTVVSLPTSQQIE